jgi:hypothetical protein
MKVGPDPAFVPAASSLSSQSRPSGLQSGVKAFQSGVDAWMDVCFGATIKADVQERCDRFIEEALEFVQAAGYSAERAHALVDYTFGRPVGEINQEVGGVMVTLAAMCNTIGVDIGSAAETELARVWTKVDVIRAKQAAKPTGSALPIALAAGTQRAETSETSAPSEGCQSGGDSRNAQGPQS